MAGATEIANLIVKLGMNSDELQKGTKGAGNAFDGLFKTIVKANVATKVLSAGFNAVKNGAAAAINVTKKFIDESTKAYATYEQMEGGVQTLFGAGGKSLEAYASKLGVSVEQAAGKYDVLMKAQSLVFENAHKAWATSGLSANQYMETVTGFSASLKQSTKDEYEAARIADMAVQDMADNANKMGTDMGSVQQAYQGFAKQNYTMLDNLKLGYGGTKQEMERLLADAEKLTGQKYDITQLDDVYNAIHAIQEELGIAGATADEAMTTIEGSSKAAAAAWDNVKVSIAGGGEDIESAFAQYGDALTAKLTNLLPRIAEIMGGIGEALYRVIPQLGEKLATLIPSIVPKFVAGGLKLAVGLVTGIGQGFRLLWQFLGEAWTQLGQVLNDLGLKDLGLKIMHAVWDGIKIGIHDINAWLYEQLGNLMTKIEGWLTEKLGKLAELPIIRDLFKDLKNVKVDLGGEDLLGKAEDRKAKSAQLKDEKTILLGEINNATKSLGEDVMEKCNDILDKEDGIAGQVSSGAKDIVDAVTPDENNNSTETLYDQIMQDMKDWYKSYSEGNYDLALLGRMQSHLNVLESRGIYVANYDVLNSGYLDPQIAKIAEQIPAVNDGFAKDSSVTGIGTIPEDVATNKGVADVIPDNLPKDSSVTGIGTIPEDVATNTGTESAMENIDIPEAPALPDNLAKDSSVQGVSASIDGITWSTAITIEQEAQDTKGIENAIRGGIKGIKVENSITPHFTTPKAEVDTSNLDTSATNLTGASTNLSGSATNLDTSAGNLDTSAQNLSSITITNPYENPYMEDPTGASKGFTNFSGHGVNVQQQKDGILAGIFNRVAGNKGSDNSEAVSQTLPSELDALQNFQGVPQNAIDSITALKDAVVALDGALNGEVSEDGEDAGAAVSGAEEGGEEGSSGLIKSLNKISTELGNIFTAAQNVATYFSGEFITAIETLVEALCVAKTNDEGESEASGGNTLYNSLGAVSGVLGDILTNTRNIIQEWTGNFLSAAEQVKQASGKAEGALQGTAAMAWNAADAFNAAATAVQAYLQSLKDLAEWKNGGGSGNGSGPITDNTPKFAASGASADRGDTFIVGEEGPELFTAHRSGYIIPNDELREAGEQPITINIEGSVYGESYLESYVVGKLTKAVRRELILAS